MIYVYRERRRTKVTERPGKWSQVIAGVLYRQCNHFPDKVRPWEFRMGFRRQIIARFLYSSLCKINHVYFTFTI